MIRSGNQMNVNVSDRFLKRSDIFLQFMLDRVYYIIYYIDSETAVVPSVYTMECE